MFGMETERLRKVIKMELVYGIKAYFIGLTMWPILNSIVKVSIIHYSYPSHLYALAQRQILSNGSTSWLSYYVYGICCSVQVFIFD